MIRAAVVAAGGAGFGGGGRGLCRKPRASMTWMSTLVRLARLPTISSNGSFGVRLDGGFDPGPRKSLESELIPQSARWPRPPSSEKYAGVLFVLLGSK